MSFTCDVNATYGFALIRATGDEWTGTDLLYSAEAVVSDDRFVPDHDWVYDLRFVRRTVIGPEDMDALVDRFQTYREDGRVDPDAR